MYLYKWLSYCRNKEEAFCKKYLFFELKVGRSEGHKLGILKEILMVKFKNVFQDSKYKFL